MKHCLLLLLFLSLLFFGCAGDDDDDSSKNPVNDDDDDNDTQDDDTPAPDDDDDNTIDPLPLNAVFVIPNYHYADSDEQIAALLDEIQAAGPDTVIWQWTLLYNKVCFPSELFATLDGMQSDDLLGALLSAADTRGMKIYLGLSAGRIPAEKFDDPVGPESLRVEMLLSELSSRYGSHESLVGFYIPYEFPKPPNQKETELLTQIARAAHEALPGSDVMMSAQYPGPKQFHYVVRILTNWFYRGMSQDDIEDSAERADWAKNTIEMVSQAGIDTLLLKTMMGNYKNDAEESYLDFSAIMGEKQAQNSPVQIWGQVDLYDPFFFAGRMFPVHGPASTDRVDVQRGVVLSWALPTAGFAWDHWVNSDGQVEPPRGQTDGTLLAKSVEIEEHLRSRGLRDWNVVTVINGQEELDQGSNLWQEDACWINGLYLGAASFRCAITNDEEDCAMADKLWGVLFTMANVTPLKGEVVRNYTRYLYTQTNPVQPGSSTIKRWHKHPTEEIYWVGDISVDQLSGYFYGLAVYYELVADEQAKEEVRQTVSSIMGLILDNNLRAYEYNGQNTTYGNLRSAPELGLTWLVMAWRITGESRFLEAYDKLIHNEQTYWKLTLYHWALHLVRNYGGQHFQDSGLYHLYSYLPAEPGIYRELIWGLEYVYQGSFTWGNAMADFTHQAHHPDSAGAARSLHNHYMYNPDYLDNGVWASEVNRDFGGGYHPMEFRPFDEWDWTHSADSPKNPRGGPNHRYPGVSYLVTYWEGRWHGWIP